MSDKEDIQLSVIAKPNALGGVVGPHDVQIIDQNGRQLRGITSLNFHVNAQDVPILTIEMFVLGHIEIDNPSLKFLLDDATLEALAKERGYRLTQVLETDDLPLPELG